MDMVQLIECPRDAMQGLKHFIPTVEKIKFLNLLLEVGFDTLDFGSFVSPKAIPQMADTAEIVPFLNKGATKLLAIVANYKGAVQAASFENIDFIGFPFSLSETFQIRNTHATLNEAFERVVEIQSLCEESGKKLVLYLSMGFGNPYNDPWSLLIIDYWLNRMIPLGIDTVQLSDTIGIATPDKISMVFEFATAKYPDLQLGVHLHTRPDEWQGKMEAAFNSGCRKFDGALLGFGGCPMAKDELVGNMPMENMVQYIEQVTNRILLNKTKLKEALDMAKKLYLSK
ncbi:MAG: hydroxymethylglutaryl-CoA lyase [Bacteroidota bacterium]|jgi:hydroxymethylglutaryl-CoA lyase